MKKLPAWPELEARFAQLPRLGVAAVCQRLAARVCPKIASAESAYGLEAIEWMNAITEVVKLLEVACLGVPVSRLTLDLAAEIARGTANSARNSVREKGPTPFAEAAELSFAVAAYSVDVLRAAQPAKSASAAIYAIRNSLASSEIPEQLIASDYTLAETLTGSGNTDWDANPSGSFGELWPYGDPEWWTAGTIRWRELQPSLPKLLRLPGW